MIEKLEVALKTGEIAWRRRPESNRRIKVLQSFALRSLPNLESYLYGDPSVNPPAFGPPTDTDAGGTRARLRAETIEDIDRLPSPKAPNRPVAPLSLDKTLTPYMEIGRASCRERV